MTAHDLISLDALAGDVGSAASAILVESLGFVICGATGQGFYAGTTGDATVHCLPSNPPTQLTFNGISIGCTASAICPLCVICPECPTNPSYPSPPPSPVRPISIPPSFVAVRAFETGIYNAFDFNLASDFFFLEDRAAGCVGDYLVYNSMRESDEKCTYDHMFWISSKLKKQNNKRKNSKSGI